MTTATLNSLEHTLQATNVWISDVTDELGWSNRDRAYLALRTVLHSLRDRLSVEHVAAFGAQLPLLVRGFYYEGWQPSGKPLRERKREQFLAHIDAVFPNDPSVDAEQVAAAVFRVIEKHISPGEVRKILGVLPRDLQSLWS